MHWQLHKLYNLGMKRLALIIVLLISSKAFPNDFIRRDGRNLVAGADNRVIFLRGINFGNYVWNNSPLPPDKHHSELDYDRVKAMHMKNFYMEDIFSETRLMRLGVLLTVLFLIAMIAVGGM